MQKGLILVALFGLAQWFFGNLYEAVVFSPNWVVDTPAQLERLNAFFVNTGPTLYFVPSTPLAVLLAWGLMVTNREPRVGADLRRAGLFGALAMALNFFIVATLITRMVGDDFRSYAADLNSYAWRWNVLNVFRMLLVGTTMHFLFAAFRKLDRHA